MLVPPRLDAFVVDAAVAFRTRFFRGQLDRIESAMRTVMGPDAAHYDLRGLAREHVAMLTEQGWGRLLGLHRDGWRPEIAVEGLDRLEAAVALGLGVIVWRMNFCSSPILKMALWQRGVRLVHLSRPEHGGSNSWLGRHGIAPLFRRAEDWYLAERLVMPSDEELRFVKTLVERLNEGAVVSIFGDLPGRQNARSPLFSGYIVTATGAPGLAHRTGATLLPAHVERLGRSRYRVVIQEPIIEDRSLPRPEFIRRTSEEFVRRLEACVRRRPADWGAWEGYRRWFIPGRASSVPTLDRV
jgi:lauroyl/myristoyl acyltransferase